MALSEICVLSTALVWATLLTFPALKKIVSKNEYDSLGEEFEKKEHELFGEGGFDAMVEKVAGLEKQLGIYDLAQFTPDGK